MILQAQKKALRERAKAKITAITLPERAQASAAACALLNHQEIWNNARVVLMYWPLPGEVDVRPLLESALAGGKTVALPQYVAATALYVAAEVSDLKLDLNPGQFGIAEPRSGARAIALDRIDLALAPGLAFDPHGMRLGRGRGFYDRILAQVQGCKCGVAFDEQIETELPIEPHDAPVDYLLTPSRFFAAARHSR